MKIKLRKKTRTEKSIDRAVKDYGESLGGVSVKLTTYGPRGKSGFPDRLWLFPGGIIFFMEMKREGEPCTELQLRKQAELRALGFRVYVCDNVLAGKEIIRAEVNGRGKSTGKRAFPLGKLRGEAA